MPLTSLWHNIRHFT